MNYKRIEAALHTLKRHAEQKSDLLLGHIVEDLRISILEEVESEGLVSTERDLLAAGKVIEAIKALRGRFMSTSDPRGTLQGAKTVVDAYVARHPLPKEKP